MTSALRGIHHVTAIATDPQRNLDFYTRVLGLRLVKRTVNFDDPGTYHLYFGDGVGRPGTVLTFFPWPWARRGVRGVGQATATAFSVPEGSLGFWRERLRREGVAAEEPRERLSGEEAFTVLDPDGLALELVAHEGADERPGWERGPVPAEHAIRGFHSVTLSEQAYEATAELLTDGLGFRLVDEAASRFRFEAGGGGAGARIDVLCAPSAPPGRVAAGTVHHVAFRVADEEAQRGWLERLAARGLNVTPVLDRQYFRSIYFREPGGVLFEIATDTPGFTLDETPETLGEALKLPPWLEPRRGEIEEALPELRLEPATP